MKSIGGLSDVALAHILPEYGLESLVAELPRQLNSELVVIGTDRRVDLLGVGLTNRRDLRLRALILRHHQVISRVVRRLVHHLVRRLFHRWALPRCSARAITLPVISAATGVTRVTNGKI